MPFCSHNNHQLFYESIGNQSLALLFIHGLGGFHGSWKYQTEFFAFRYQIVTIDLFGHGESSRDVDPVMAPRIDAEAIDHLMRNLIGKPYFVIGHSFAGFVMSEIIKLGDPNLKGVIFVDCTYPGFKETIYSRAQFGNLMTALPDDQLVIETAKWYSRLIGPTAEPDDREFIFSSLRRCNYRWLFQSVAGCRDFVSACPPQDTPIRSDLPIFVIEADHGVGGDFTKSWINHFREADYYLLENTYHFPLVTNHDRFNSLLDKFLSDNSFQP